MIDLGICRKMTRVSRPSLLLYRGRKRGATFWPHTEIALPPGIDLSSSSNHETGTMKFSCIALYCSFLLVVSVNAESGTFRLESPEWHDGGTVPMRNLFNGSGCNGSNISPGFHWLGAPKGTRSFAITIYDPDAPSPGGWWHWVVFNIPSPVSTLPAGAGDKASSRLPPGSSQCRNDYGESGYGGPCPPPGATHRYVAKIYALDVEKISARSDAPPGRVAKQIQEHSIGSAQLTVSFGS
jgi:Raf kinase inhibitor-like YbhB/YbcL family protein